MQKVDIIPVACPTCKNKRLFDIDLHTEGNIQIKCPKCRSIVRVQVLEIRIWLWYLEKAWMMRNMWTLKYPGLNLQL